MTSGCTAGFMVSDQNTAAAKIQAMALANRAHASTYCLIDQTTGANGTVVAVNIGSRHFLATAAHLIPASHQFTVVLRDSIDGVYDFAARHIHPTLDVGLLELLPNDIPRFNDTFVPANAISPSPDQRGEYSVTVIGYPSKLIDQIDSRPLTRNETLEVQRCNAFTFHSVALPLSEWPKSGTMTPPDPANDIFIDFHPEESMYLINAKASTDTPVKIDAPAPHPAGISGGGIWMLRHATTDTVWQPTAYLHGIQFGFNPAGWLRGALIDTWLGLVADNYPELKSEIKDIRERSNLTNAT